jgi:hypothetical protein
MILHYVTDHGYAPPKEFQSAVVQFDLSSGWSGKAEQLRLVKDLFERLNGQEVRT